MQPQNDHKNKWEGRTSHDWLRLIGEAYPRFVQQVFPDAA
jgi:hypothetical protein